MASRDEEMGAPGCMVMVLIVFLLFMLHCHNEIDCDEKGGVYLWREGKCVTGIQEIK